MVEKLTEAMKVGDRVEKYTGDYQIEGWIVAVFSTRRGHIRYVVEHDPGFLHIYSDKNLRAVSTVKEAALQSTSEETRGC